ncbi:hypothetical protein ACIQ9R_04645 [Streptomyces sp. NPDC094447]|uniref:hypothetical protein n=1 Tax=Streptomyces sp. NPDC094447 TaxID=3366062 RepID=UPI0038076559
MVPGDADLVGRTVAVGATVTGGRAVPVAFRAVAGGVGVGAEAVEDGWASVASSCGGRSGIVTVSWSAGSRSIPEVSPTDSPNPAASAPVISSGIDIPLRHSRFGAGAALLGRGDLRT